MKRLPFRDDQAQMQDLDRNAFEGISENIESDECGEGPCLKIGTAALCGYYGLCHAYQRTNTRIKSGKSSFRFISVDVHM